MYVNIKLCVQFASQHQSFLYGYFIGIMSTLAFCNNSSCFDQTDVKSFYAAISRIHQALHTTHTAPHLGRLGCTVRLAGESSW